MNTNYVSEVPDKLLIDYVEEMKNKIYKCLPMYEENIETLSSYIDSILYELCGGSKVFGDPVFVEIINKTAYLNVLNEHSVFRRQVFDCTAACDKLIKNLGGTPRKGGRECHTKRI